MLLEVPVHFAERDAPVPIAIRVAGDGQTQVASEYRAL